MTGSAFEEREAWTVSLVPIFNVFKRELKQTGRLQELRDRRYFTPKSEKRRVQLQRAKYFQKMESLRDKQ